MYMYMVLIKPDLLWGNSVEKQSSDICCIEEKTCGDWRVGDGITPPLIGHANKFIHWCGQYIEWKKGIGLNIFYSLNIYIIHQDLHIYIQCTAKRIRHGNDATWPSPTQYKWQYIQSHIYSLYLIWKINGTLMLLYIIQHVLNFIIFSINININCTRQTNCIFNHCNRELQSVTCQNKFM